MPAIFTVGQLLPNGATVTFDSFVTQADGTTVEDMTAVYPNGTTERSTTVTPGPNTPAGIQQTLQQGALTALTNNAAYLAIANPTNAQVAAQVAALTRQMNRVIRLILNQFDTTAGT